MLEYCACITALKEKTYLENLDGFEMWIKPIPETDQAGVADPREAKWFRSIPAPYRVKDPNNVTAEEIQIIRNNMGCENQDLSHGVSTSAKIIPTPIGDVPILIYTPAGKGPFRLVCYFHGGGFIGGTTKVVENACRLIAERANATVISVDYSLAPERRFPQGLLECWGIVQWSHDHASELNIQSDKIAVSGDSAGGNLAMACCLMDRQRIIKLQLLLYPGVLFSPHVNYQWSMDAYTMCEDVELLQRMVNDVKISTPFVHLLYTEKETDLYNQLVSPFLAADYKDFPTTFIATAEFDYLRIQNELYGKKLRAAGVPVHFFRYKGMAHAFFEHTGEFPQAEDCTDEMAKLIRAM